MRRRHDHESSDVAGLIERQQVTNARQIIEGLGLEIATPDDAREILGLKGADKVNF